VSAGPFYNLSSRADVTMRLTSWTTSPADEILHCPNTEAAEHG